MNNYKVCSLVKHLSKLNCHNRIIVKPLSVRNYSGVSSAIILNNGSIFKDRYYICYNKDFRRCESSAVETTIVGSGTISDSIFFKLSGSQAVGYFQKFLLTVHDSTGLPWWATIALTTFLLRGVVAFPLAIYQAYISAKVENISLMDMPEVAKDVKDKITRKAIQLNWTAKEASYHYKYEMKSEWDKLIVAQNCHPVKATLPIWFQIPTWVCFSTALRNISYMLPLSDADAQIRFMEMSLGGFLWVPNMTVPDSTFILPVLLGLSNLVIIEIQCMMRMREATKAQRYATNFFRGFSIILVPIASTVPSGVCFYWAVSSALGLCQNLILMSNRVRSGFGIPDTPTTLDRPYAHLAKEIALKLRLSDR